MNGRPRGIHVAVSGTIGETQLVVRSIHFGGDIKKLSLIFHRHRHNFIHLDQQVVHKDSQQKYL